MGIQGGIAGASSSQGGAWHMGAQAGLVAMVITTLVVVWTPRELLYWAGLGWHL